MSTRRQLRSPTPPPALRSGRRVRPGLGRGKGPGRSRVTRLQPLAAGKCQRLVLASDRRRPTAGARRSDMGSNVKITWDEGAIKRLTEDATRGAMNAASSAASRVRCSEHGETVKIIDRNPRTGEFKLEG